VAGVEEEEVEVEVEKVAVLIIISGGTPTRVFSGKPVRAFGEEG
jgi:hypothetical protein